MQRGLIALTTDFGDADGFVGVMKGVIAGIAPEAHVIDLCHGVSRGDIRHGAFVLLCAVGHFPDGTIHVGVVDPGVGTDRRAICVCAGSQVLIGPDNGLLSWAARRLGGARTYHVTRSDLFADEVSSTFHGRDVFAPVAAHLAMGVRPDQLGPEVTDVVELPFPEVETSASGDIVGEVIHVDRFGNLITNIQGERLAARNRVSLTVRAGGQVIRGLSETYGSKAVGELGALIGSSGYLEVAVNGGSAGVTTGLAVGDRVRISGGEDR